MTTGIFTSNNSNNRTLTLGTFLKIGGNVATAQSILVFTTATGLIFNKNNAFVEILVPTSAILGWDIRPGGLTWNALILDANSSFNSGLNLTGAGNFTTWTIGAGWTLIGQSAINYTLSGTATFNGTPTRPIGLFLGSAIGTIPVISASSCTATWTSFYGVTVPTGCVASNGNNYGALTGITITQPRFGGVIGG